MAPLIIENAHFRVEHFPETSATTLIDKARDTTWSSASLFRLIYGEPYGVTLTPRHCKTECIAHGESLNLHLHSFRCWARWPEHDYCRPQNPPDLHVRLGIRLCDDRALLTIAEVEGMDDEGLRVEFPCGLFRLQTDRAGAMIVPELAGAMYLFPCRGHYRMSAFMQNAFFSLPFFAWGTAEGGLLAIVTTAFDCELSVDINQSQAGSATLTPSFAFERRHANYPREIELHSLATVTPEAVAALYRRRLADWGRFVPLTEKIRRSPEVEKLVGAVVWKHSVYSAQRPPGVEKAHSLYVREEQCAQREGTPANWTAQELFTTARQRGFDRLVVYNTGWNYGGYDSHYPTRLPPNPERGTVEDFRRAAEFARSLSPDFIYSVHDNYYDAYRNSPEWDEGIIKKTGDGALMRLGIWRGGREFLLCPSAAMRYARRDLPRIRAMLGKGSIYLDCTGCAIFTGCFDPNHPLGRRDEAQTRRELLEFTRQEMGSVASEGLTADYLADVVDLGAFFGVHPPADLDPRPLPVPLYQLVYHDAVLNYTHEGYFKFYGSEYVLYTALYGLLPYALDDVSLKLSKELRSAYTAPLRSCDALEPVFVRQDAAGYAWTSGVRRSRFGDGTVVVANFNSDAPFVYRGRPVPPRDFLIARE